VSCVPDVGVGRGPVPCRAVRQARVGALGHPFPADGAAHHAVAHRHHRLPSGWSPTRRQVLDLCGTRVLRGRGTSRRPESMQHLTRVGRRWLDRIGGLAAPRLLHPDQTLVMLNDG